MILTASEVRDAFKYLFPDELPALKGLVALLPPNPTIINIGAGAGTSGLAFLESRPDVTLLTIDITDASSPFGCLQAERDVVQRAGLYHLWGHQWFQYHGNSTDALQSLHHTPSLATLSGEFPMWDSADLIFIDGDHSYEHCKSDILNSIPLLGQGSILTIHDYRKAMLAPDPNGPHPVPWPGVDQAVDELLSGSMSFQTISLVSSLIAFRRLNSQ